jgi:hypothetical protein
MKYFNRKQTYLFLGLISEFHRDLDDICALLGFTRRRVVIVYLHFGTTYRSLLGLFEDMTDTLSRNVGKQLPHDAAQYPRRSQISFLGLFYCVPLITLPLFSVRVVILSPEVSR